MTQHPDSFGSLATLRVGSRELRIHRLDALPRAGLGDVATLPFSLRVLLENLLRREDGRSVTREHVVSVAAWQPQAQPSQEIVFLPARVLLQDFTGVPAVVDLAAMREAFASMGGDAARINPLLPAELVIDHSVQVDAFGTRQAFAQNAAKEMSRNVERYQFLRWGQKAFRDFRVVPPDTGIVHQVNLEYLAKVVFVRKDDGREWAYPDTLVGTDSHTTMVNGLGVLGWGVGGIEAEAAMLGQPVVMLVPEVVGFRLTGELPEGATATDLVLTVTQALRRKGVVGKFVEFFGGGLDQLSLPDRATLSNMAPEYGATVGFFPVDAETLAYLRFTGRDEDHVKLVEAYCKEQGLFRTPGAPEPRFSDTLELDMGDVEPSIAGPKRPQDRVTLESAKRSWRRDLADMLGAVSKVADPKSVSRWLGEGGAPLPPLSSFEPHHELGPIRTRSPFSHDGRDLEIGHGAVVIAAITSCTNTSNPAVMIAAGLLARKAMALGLTVPAWVKTSLAPGSQVVMEYLERAGLLPSLEKLGFHLVGYGCTTCIGNSGPLPDAVGKAITDGDLVAVAVLSGNRNFEGRVHPHVRANYLASPPLVVAYALAGTADFDPMTEPLGSGPDGAPVFLKDVWPSQAEVRDTLRAALQPEMFRKVYANVDQGTPEWRALATHDGQLFSWDAASTYVRKPPFFDEVKRGQPPSIEPLRDARVLALLGDSVTTDHISPAGNISPNGPAGQYLQQQGVAVEDFNSYGARRGNHEVMVRGTFANVRLRNLLAPGTEGGVTRHVPSGEVTSIHDAAVRYAAAGVPLLVIAGREYGSGSSRDWAAKGPKLLGVRAVIAQSFERIHRSNLVGMGILPLQFLEGESAASLGLTGEELYDVDLGVKDLSVAHVVTVHARIGSEVRTFSVVARVDTPLEVDYYRHGGILPYVLRQLAG